MHMHVIFQFGGYKCRYLDCGDSVMHIYLHQKYPTVIEKYKPHIISSNQKVDDTIASLHSPENPFICVVTCNELPAYPTSHMKGEEK